MPKTNNLSFPCPVSITEDEFGSETAYFRVHKTFTQPSDATTEDQMNVIEASGVLDFWDHPEEDAYNENNDDAL